MAAFFKSRKAIFLGVAIVFVVIIAVFFTLYSKKDDDKGPTDEYVVSTTYGKLRGTWIDRLPGKKLKYVAFKGVPYAQPPVKDLRFKGPKPMTPWTGIRDALVEGNSCTQAGTIGSEDCLYLNVYTPRLPSAKENPKFAVYVFIHGGVFQYGNSNSNEFGPDFIVSQDVVVVTMNYRIGILASLSLDTDDVPGNAGLKDQLQVLRWVHDNIANFGGDPSKVTLGGQSSGSVSASWLTLLPQTKSLIRSAITQSGTAVASWGLNYKREEFADAVYTHLTGKNSGTVAEKTFAFKEASYLELYYAAENATILLQTTKGVGTDISFFYLPSLEKRQQGEEELLIRNDPESYFISKEANDIPLILGETQEEWTIFYAMQPMFDNEALLQSTIKDLITYVPRSIIPGEDTQKLLAIEDFVSKISVTKLVDDIRDQFFLSPSLPADCNTNCRMSKFMNQVYIMVDSSHMLRLRSKYLSSPTYAYIFNLLSDYNHNRENLPDYLKNDVVHGSDLNYTWRSARNPQDFYGNSTASRAVRRQVTMLTNFIKYGDPTPMPTDVINIQWQPVKSGGQETYLEITDTLTQRSGSMAGPDGDFWARQFETTCRAGKSP
ncbi:para-nitrobenzyl esterase-like [Thrips palmi]|uniref:Carboxylic ester hydrolase n=1 Tax=Thrips palmi TaxID=161013 RepID=A0A6P8ZN09_THRPL|nr:para-nitrobenzyl esterase-like [Thrips palmi]